MGKIRENASRLGNVIVETTLENFSFLMNECHFFAPKIEFQHKASSDDFTEIYYRSECAFLKLFYAHMEGEIVLKIGFLLPFSELAGTRGFELSEVLSLIGANVILPPSVYRAYGEENLREAIRILAYIVRTNLIDILGNPCEILSRFYLE